MKYNDCKMEDIKIAYIGGGSRGWAWTFMTDLAMEEAFCNDPLVKGRAGRKDIEALVKDMMAATL